MNPKFKSSVRYRAGDGLMYNGIRQPTDWPPGKVDPMSDHPPNPPYLIAQEDGGTRPHVIDITIGRQLFVDDFLIHSTDLTPVYYTGKKYEQNPILSPETEDELRKDWGVGLSAGGVWYDMQEQKYKMWYDIAFNWGLGYAESTDGIHWERQLCCVDNNGKPTSTIMDGSIKDGTCGVFIDYECDPSEKYKMFMQSFLNQINFEKPGDQPNIINSEYLTLPDSVEINAFASTLYVSGDGIHWRQIGGLSKSVSGDASSAYYDAFRCKWINSIRAYAKTFYKDRVRSGRARWYAEGDKFTDLLEWTPDRATFWLKCDRDDPIDLASGFAPQMYNFNAIGYESILYGGWQIWRGPENGEVVKTGNPKITEIMASFSRDGFNVHRPSRVPLISASRLDGYWDKGYLFAAPASLIVYDDEIRIYYSAFSGYKGDVKDGHGCQQIGFVTLRRDGFASMNGKGELFTRPLTVNNGKKHLFVNVKTSPNSFRAEIIKANGAVLEGFARADCIPVGGDSTCQQITWKNGRDLSFLNGNEFRIRFYMEDDGEFYSFWLSSDENGTSDGAMGAGYVPSKNLFPKKSI